MAVQPARISPADLRHPPAPPRVRQTRMARSTLAPQPAARSLAAGAALRPPTQAVRIPAATAGWTGMDRRMRSRLRVATLLLGTIIVGTMLGLVYLTQTLSATTARYTVDRLLVEREELMRQISSQEVNVAAWGSEARVIQWAQGQGLDRLGQPVRVKGR